MLHSSSRNYTALWFVFKSTTITLILSQLFRPRASRVSSAAAEHALREENIAPLLSPSTEESLELKFPDGSLCRRHSLPTAHAISLDTTSHKPSLARIKHSSSASLFVKVISGSDVIYGFKLLSPVCNDI